jgi:hypothetical protein
MYFRGQEACRLNGGNVHDTSHSSEAAPMAALAELYELAFRQLQKDGVEKPADVKYAYCIILVG